MEGESLIALPTDQPKEYIFGGGNADPHEFPYQVRLSSAYGNLCGGTIIHTFFILTAAHCLYKQRKERWKVHAGDHSRSHIDDITEQIRKISQVYAHEDFHKPTFENDIALLVLSQPLEFNEYVNKISYPRTKNPEYEENATVSGWGKLTDGDIYVPDILQKVSVPLVSKWECQKIYNRTSQKVTNDMMCAGSRTRDSCFGDSGGPLTCDEKQTGRKVLCGVVSFGIACGRLKYPGVYMDVSQYWHWIELTMAKHVHGANFLAVDNISTNSSKYLPTPLPSFITDLPSTATGLHSNIIGLRSSTATTSLSSATTSLPSVTSDQSSRIKENHLFQNVYCDMEDDAGGWTLIHRRGVHNIPKAQRESFHRNWMEYEEGFGSVDDDHWIGLKKMHSLTRQCENELKITLTRWNGTKLYGSYSNFQVAGVDEDYRVTIGSWTGGSLIYDGDVMEWNSGMKFTTFDNDNDKWDGGNCAVKANGAWWHNGHNSSACTWVKLTGEYPNDGSYGIMETGISWIAFGWNYSGKKSEMKIRPKC